MASYNRRYSTLHSPDEPQLPFSALHTPVEPNNNNPFRQSPHGSGISIQQFTPQSDVYSPPVGPSSFTSRPSTMASQYPTDQFQAQPQPMPSQGLSSLNSQQQQQQQMPAMSPNDTGTLGPHSTGSRTPQAIVGSAVPSVHGSVPGSPGLPPLPGVDTYMMTPQPPQPARSPPPSFEQYQAQHHPPQQPMSPPPAFNPLDPNPYDQQQQHGQTHPSAPPEPSQASTYNASDASASPVAPKAPVYTPGALAGPNGGVHAPGQIGHPNQQHDEEDYHHGLCDCLSDPGTCCTGYWCPCILYSKTYHRLKTIPNSNVNEFSAFNSHCALFCFLAPVSFIFTTLQRSRVRDHYRLKGSFASDCAKAYCCVSCTLIQDDREVCHREDERRRFAGPGSGVVGDGGYKRNPTMTYP